MDVRDNNEDAASDASWDDNASSASYDTLSNWAGESTGWPTESEDWSLTTNKRIVEARRMDALSPQESWDSALDRALLGSKVLGEHIEGPWDECPGSSRGGGGIIAGFWEGDAPPQYDDGSCCGDSDPMSSSHVSASSLYSDESPALTGGSTTGDSPSHASAVDPLEPKASYSVSEEELQLSQSTIIKALKEEKPRPLQYTYVNNGEYVPFDPDADPVARHTGWHPPRPDLPPITFLRPREGRFNLHGGRGFRLSSPLDSSKTKKSAGAFEIEGY
ncbi:hypothetical protein BKA62DRAFT_128964 [Auriculariales sp. MPI-PUGE-AT-0066]|nr:hypothetical protein BKA62DRAFT_128964 [Auriculariales sp. MPI-PUGE-AT-0066]